MASVTRRNFRRLSAALALAGAAALSLAGAAAADARQKVTPKIGHNEIVVADNDELRDQIRACWNVPATTRRGDFVVHVMVELRPDGTVQNASVVGNRFSTVDPYRRAVAESARGALISARCNPLRVPDGVARKGERITLTINPAAIFGN